MRGNRHGKGHPQWRSEGRVKATGRARLLAWRTLRRGASRCAASPHPPGLRQRGLQRREIPSPRWAPPPAVNDADGTGVFKRRRNRRWPAWIKYVAGTRPPQEERARVPGRPADSEKRTLGASRRACWSRPPWAARSPADRRAPQGDDRRAPSPTAPRPEPRPPAPRDRLIPDIIAERRRRHRFLLRVDPEQAHGPGPIRRQRQARVGDEEYYRSSATSRRTPAPDGHARSRRFLRGHGVDSRQAPWPSAQSAIEAHYLSRAFSQ